MKLLHKYYRWRASRTKDGFKQAHFRKMAYYCSTIFRKGNFVGRDLTTVGQSANTWDLKQDLTSARFGDKAPNDEAFKVGYDKRAPGRYLDGPVRPGYVDGETKKWVDPNEWKETPQWWAEVEEANQQHMPNYRTPRARGTITKFDPSTGKRTYWKYNYKTGQQEKID